MPAIEGERLGTPPPEPSLRSMETRRGSCTKSGRIWLNPKLMQVSTPLNDYVILHTHHHSPAFCALLDRVLPGRR